MAPTLPAITRAIALAPSSPRRKDPSSAAKRPSTDPAAPVAKRTKKKAPPPPSAASPTSPRLKEPPPNARPQAASIGPTTPPAKNREAQAEGNKRKARPPPDTSGAMADPPAKRKTGQFQGKDALAPKTKTLDEMRLLYPYLVDEAMALVDQSVVERVLTSIDEEEAQALDKKIKRARKKLAKAVMTSVGANNMEMPTLLLFSSTKLQPEKLQHILIQERLTRAEREIVELKQVIIASQSQAKMESIPRHDHLSMKGRCESAESGLQSIVAENQSPDTRLLLQILQKKVEVPNGLVHGKNGATSKYRCAVSCSVPRNNQQVHGVILPPFAVARGRPRKVYAKKSNSKQSGQLP
ncbi:hypothetical protein BS78_06G000800 [Paspalum vaginatum]|nr:hypothetical protein BS78_06G000800 [Paspalum vaginatum]